jgi:hypothetical protein
MYDFVGGCPDRLERPTVLKAETLGPGRLDRLHRPEEERPAVGESAQTPIAVPRFIGCLLMTSARQPGDQALDRLKTLCVRME